jgi:uncharacterized protein (UPF0179 family)
MGKISMVGTSLAKEGQMFTYIGMTEECIECKFNKVCQDMVAGRRYKVTALRDKEHDCPIHEGGKVRVVEVEETEIEMSIPSRKALEGALVKLEEEECPLTWCSNHRLCRRNIYGAEELKVNITAVHEELKCPRELKLKRSVVTLQ